MRSRILISLAAFPLFLSLFTAPVSAIDPLDLVFDERWDALYEALKDARLTYRVSLPVLNPAYWPSALAWEETYCSVNTFSQLTGCNPALAYQDMIFQGVFHPAEGGLPGEGSVAQGPFLEYMRSRGVQVSNSSIKFSNPAQLKAILNRLGPNQIIVVDTKVPRFRPSGHVVPYMGKALREMNASWLNVDEWWKSQRVQHGRAFQVSSVPTEASYTEMVNQMNAVIRERNGLVCPLRRAMAKAQAGPTLTPMARVGRPLIAPASLCGSLWPRVFEATCEHGPPAALSTASGFVFDMAFRDAARDLGFGKSGQHWIGSLGGYTGGNIVFADLAGLARGAVLFNPWNLLIGSLFALHTSPTGRESHRFWLDKQSEAMDYYQEVYRNPKSTARDKWAATGYLLGSNPTWP